MVKISNEPEEQDDTDVSSLTLREILPPIWAARKQILIFSFVVGVLTLGINFLLPKYYKSTATLLPESERNKVTTLSQFADVAQFAGINVPGAEVSRLYPTLVTSETLLGSVIERKYLTKRFSDSVDLVQYFDFADKTPEEGRDLVLTGIRGLMTTSYDARSGIVTLTLEMREPKLAAELLNSLIRELDKFMREKRISSASEQRKWIEVRLKQVEQELHSGENVLKDFREKNRSTVSSPQLRLEEERLLREVQVKSTIYVELMKQNELAKIAEIKNTSIVNVLDPARPAIKKDRPKRALNTFIAFCVAFLVGASFFAVRSVYGSRMATFAKSLRSRDVGK